MRSVLRLVLGVLGLVCISFVLQADDTTGSVQGAITDPSGAAIPGAQVELANEATGVLLKQQTGADGRYIFNVVPPGSYLVKASNQGFRSGAVQGVRVEVNTTARGDLVLQLGAVTETVEVTTAAAHMDTVSAQVTSSVPETYLTEIPTDRNTLSMAEMAPGVEISGPAQGQMFSINGTSANVNGNREGRNVFFLDGSDNTGSFRNASLQMPNPEAVQTMNVSTSNTSAEFGKQSGGIFNVVTKSGTNQLHGSAFYFLHNENLNANTWDRNRSGSPRTGDNMKVLGGTLGGPIRRDKTFFFGSYMLYRTSSQGFQNTIQFPTPAMVRGDFSQFGRQLYDPDTGQPLPGNLIPQRLLDPVAQNIMKKIPTVANFGDRLVTSFVNPNQNQEILGKVDHNFNSRHSLQATWFHAQGYNRSDIAGNVPDWGGWHGSSNHQNTVSARHTWVAGSNLVLQSRFALAKHVVLNGCDKYDVGLADFGVNWPQVFAGALKVVPALQIANGFQAGNPGHQQFDQHNYHVGSTLNWIRGQHNLKFGAEFQRDTVAQIRKSEVSQFTFDGSRASTPAGGRAQGTNVFGYAAADFFMGRIATFNIAGQQDYNLSNWSNFFFAQDEWRVSRRLTVTPGLRYELYTPATETRNKAAAFAYNHQSNQYPNAPLGMALLGDQGIPAGFFPQDRNNFAPRLGIAYDLTGKGKSVIRAGAGYYYNYNSTQIKLWNAEGPPWRPLAAGGDTTSFVDPWGTSRNPVYPKAPTPFPDDVSNFPYSPRITGMVGYDRTFRTPYSLQWNVTFAQVISRGLSISATYVANRAFKQLQALEGNQAVWADNATVNNVDNRRPLSRYGHVGIVNSRARSWYDAFQAMADVRLSRGLTARLTYVLANGREIWGNDPTGNGQINTANPKNLDGEKAPFLGHHTVKGFYVYQLPFLRSSHRLAGKLAGGWQLSGSLVLRTGNPIDVQLGEDWNYDGVSGDRPNLVGPIHYVSDSTNRYFDPSAFAQPQIRNTFGTLSRNALWGPGSWSTNTALAKYFRITEQKRIQIRAEAFDTFNHPNLANPNTNMRNADFTRIVNRNGNRTAQMVLRFLF